MSLPRPRPGAVRAVLAAALAAAALPVAAASAGSAASAAGEPAPRPRGLEGELPFLDGPPNRIYLDLAPSDSARRLRVMLDTGASYSVFSPQAAKDAGVRPRRLKSTPYRRGTLLDRSLLFWIDTSWSDNVTASGWDWPLLGGNFLEHYVLEIDFPARTVRFWDPDERPVPAAADAPGETVVPMRLNARRPVIEVEVGGTRIPALVDTGAPAGLVVSGDQAREAGLAPLPGIELHLGGTVGSTTARFAEAPSVRIGSLTLERAPALVLPNGFYNLGAQGDALVGYDLLAEFVVRFDYEHGRAWLRHATPRRALLGHDYAVVRELGALLAPADEEDHAEVIGLWPDSPAVRSGLAVGDVLELDGGADALAAVVRGGGRLQVERAEAGWRARAVSVAAPPPAAEGPGGG